MLPPVIVIGTGSDVNVTPPLMVVPEMFTIQYSVVIAIYSSAAPGKLLSIQLLVWISQAYFLPDSLGGAKGGSQR